MTVSMLPRHIEIELTRYIFDTLKISADAWLWLDDKDKLDLLLMAARELDMRIGYRVAV